MKKPIKKRILIPLILLAVEIGILLPPYFLRKGIPVAQVKLTFVAVCCVFFVSLKGYKLGGATPEESLENNATTIQEILQLTDILTETHDNEDLFQSILEKAMGLTKQGEKGNLLVLNTQNQLECRAALGYDKEKIEKLTWNPEKIMAYLGKNRCLTKPCKIKDMQDFLSTVLEPFQYQTLKSTGELTMQTGLSCPIVIDDIFYGIINIDSKEENAFDPMDITMMEFFARQAGIVIKHHRLIDEVVYLSRHDSLTNTYNRRYFEEMYFSLMGTMKESKRTFSLVYFDLDNLKDFNDTYGHHIGDQAILTFVHTLKKNIRETDLLARYGGDEFIALFFNAEKECVRQRILKIKELLKQSPLEVDGEDIQVKFSYGIAQYPEDHEELETLIQKADQRMYRHKPKRIISDGA